MGPSSLVQILVCEVAIPFSRERWDLKLAYLERTGDGKTKFRIAGTPVAVASVSVSNKIKIPG